MSGDTENIYEDITGKIFKFGILAQNVKILIFELGWFSIEECCM